MKLYSATFPLLLLLIMVIEDSRASNNGLNDELRFLHREIGLLRSENQDQKNEIALLKETVGLKINGTIPEQIVSLIKKELDEQKKKESLIPISTKHYPDSLPEKARHRNKRPFRLIPLDKSKDATSDESHHEIRKFYGPPSNCFELSQLGYTLNGFYLVQSPENRNSSTKDGKIQVEAISCKFKHLNGSKVIETMPVDIKYDIKPYAEELLVRKLPDKTSTTSTITSTTTATSTSTTTKSTNKNKSVWKSYDVSTAAGVYFRVRSTSFLETSKSTINIIKFNDIILNIGGGNYDKSSGMFIVSKTGIYQVAFSGMISSNTASLSNPTIIELRVNDVFNEFTRIVDTQLVNQVLLATIKLQQRDTLCVRINIDKENSVKRKTLQLHSQAILSVTLWEEITA